MTDGFPSQRASYVEVCPCHDVNMITAVHFFLDSMSIARLQEQLREARRQLDKERSTRTSAENKRKTVEKEKSEMIQ